MSQQVETTSRDAVLVEDAQTIRMMGLPVIEALPSAGAPYELTDRSSSCTRDASASPTWRVSTRGIRTAGSTTSGTS